ncbi:hypothetical protein B296_00007310 [Ensete ventricosum]|uniref:Uncharacterized protein n=1 Tax=Ensete ventricosum TaxID=4639 RepID=A0A426ZEC4_ENSVE|nr:hypothetical protein B296_00007310 [Ensete ventricosum]
MVRTATVDGRRQQAPRRLGRLLRQRPTTVVGRHGRKAMLEDKGRWCDRGHRQRAGRRGIEVADRGRGDRGKKRQRAWLRQKRLRREGGNGGPARAATAGSDKEARKRGRKVRRARLEKRPRRGMADD